MKINLTPPALIFIVESLPRNTGGCANGPVVRLLTKYENDKGILQHELEHVKQYWSLNLKFTIVLLALATFFNLNPYYAVIGFAAHGLLYGFIKPYRYWAELKAYAVQLQYSEDKEKDLQLFGGFIADSYKLNVSKEKATIALKVFYNKL